MSHALKFSQDYQEMKSGKSGLSHKQVVSRTLESNLSLIDKPKSVGNIVYFTDDTWVVWTGNGWRVCEPSEEELKEIDEHEKTTSFKSVINSIECQRAIQAEGAHLSAVNNNSGGNS